MKLWLSMLVILLPLGVMAAPAGYSSFSHPDLEALGGTPSLTGAPATQNLSHDSLKDQRPTLILAHSAADAPGKSEGSAEEEIDLREVDWDKVKADKKDKGGKTEVGNGDKEEEEAGEEKEEEGEEEKGEEGGWDRLWDAPKLG